MGWKSTIDITREEAIRLILEAQGIQNPYASMTNQELENLLYEFDYGDDTNLPYYGYNFIVKDEA